MEREEVLKVLRTAAAETLQVDEDKVTESASFADDLQADSLDLVELVMALEDELELTIEEDALEGVSTVSDALDVIMAAKAAAA